MPLDPLEKETHPLLGAEIDKYKIVEVLNAGGMGIVFKARQKIMDRDIALKLLPPELAKDEVNLQRLEREAKALAQLNHPNIIATYDFGLTDTAQGYLAMEYVEGQSLDELLEKVGILKPGRAVYIFKQIADGIRFAHQKGIVHRDLKPQNIMLTDIVSKDQVKILDFGIARIAQDSKRLTRVGEVVGSPIYMAPEQCMGEAADGRADVYAFGVLIFRALTGHFPHMGPNLHETFMAKCTKDPPYFKDVSPRLHLPVELENICRKCLQRKPDDRYQQMEQVRDDLERILMPTSATNPGASGAYVSQGQDSLGSEYDLMQNMSPELYQTGWVHFDKNSGSSFRPASDSNSFENLAQPLSASGVPAPAQAQAPAPAHSAPPAAQEFQTAPPPPRQPMPGSPQVRPAQAVRAQEHTIKAKNFAMVIALASIAVVAILALVGLAFIKTTAPAAKEKSNSIQEMEKVFQDKQLREKAEEEAKPESTGLNIKSIEQSATPEKSISAPESNVEKKSTGESSSVDSADYQKTRFGHLDTIKSTKEETVPQAKESEEASENFHQSEIPSSTDRGLTLSPNTVSERIKGKSPSAALRENKTKEEQYNNRDSTNKDPDAFDANR
ncbi:MAG: serine/threonine-protein kinase [Candidatus Melainabacteria bacterium]|nr:serine/threonine-protein kinase [Candidatus Melainabacteria bacterium]